MKSKLFLALSMVFLIAVIYDTVQIFQHGMINISMHFFMDYILTIGGFISMYFFYSYYKNK